MKTYTGISGIAHKSIEDVCRELLVSNEKHRRILMCWLMDCHTIARQAVASIMMRHGPEGSGGDDSKMCFTLEDVANAARKCVPNEDGSFLYTSEKDATALFAHAKATIMGSVVVFIQYENYLKYPELPYHGRSKFLKERAYTLERPKREVERIHQMLSHTFVSEHDHDIMAQLMKKSTEDAVEEYLSDRLTAMIRGDKLPPPQMPFIASIYASS